MDPQALPAHFRSAKALLAHVRAQRVAALDARFSSHRTRSRDRWVWLLALAVVPGWSLLVTSLAYTLLRAPGLRPFPTAFVLAMTEAMNPRRVRIEALACLRTFLEDERVASLPDGPLGFRDPALPTGVRVACLEEAAETVRRLERSPDPAPRMSLKSTLIYLDFMTLIYLDLMPGTLGPHERDRTEHFMKTFDQDIAPRLRAAFTR